ncbi:MAG: hypothetical protein Q9157_001011 [Trypethelium eluteriae]
MCFGRKAEDPDVKKNEEIERQLRLDKKKAQREVKLLLLGAGESGKSTVLKQMRLINHGAFQKPERKQWRAIIFTNLVNAFQVLLSAMSEHEIEFENPENINQMQEALMLFESIANSKYFERSALILFLNKIDLFREKLVSGQSSVKTHFPDYTGSDTDTKAAQEFFAEKFRNLLRQPNKDVYVHYTNATDTDLLKKTMASVQDMIVQRNLNALIL